MKPVRLQLSRRKGFDLQALSLATNGLPAVVVARPSKWGNLFKVGDYHPYALPGNLETEEDRAAMRMDAETCVACFELSIATALMLTSPGEPIFPELRGKNLACWCKPEALFCHADLLLKHANSEATK